MKTIPLTDTEGGFSVICMAHKIIETMDLLTWASKYSFSQKLEIAVQDVMFKDDKPAASRYFSCTNFTYCYSSIIFAHCVIHLLC